MRTKDDPHRNFTTTLPDALLRELDEAARETGLKKNEILIQAFAEWNKERNQ